jgi:hypothetical protein
VTSASDRLGTTLWHILTTFAENVPVYSAPDVVLAVTSTIEFEGAAEQGDVRRGLITAHGVVRGSSRLSSHGHLGEPSRLSGQVGRGQVAFRLVHARYDRNTYRAYVELRGPEDDGGDILASAIFSFRSSQSLTERQIEQEIVRKARYRYLRDNP